MVSVTLKCPKCKQHYSVELEPGEEYDEITCENCGTLIPYSAQVKTSAEPEQRKSSNPGAFLSDIAISFFFLTGIGNIIFLIRLYFFTNITGNEPIFNAIFLFTLHGWGITLILLAIYFKIPKQPK